MAIGLEELGLLTVRRYDSEAEAPDLLRSAVSDLSDPELALAAD